MSVDYLAALKREVVPALGCTEPTTVALAAAQCRGLLSSSCQRIEVQVSASLYKNAKGVYVPGTGRKGLEVAAAAGWVAGEPDAGLLVLASLGEQHQAVINTLTSQNRIRVSYQECDDPLYTRVCVVAGADSCEVVIECEHTRITQKWLNGECIYSAPVAARPQRDVAASWSLNQILEFVAQVPLTELMFLQQGVQLNSRLSREGLEQSYGAAVGRTLQQQQQDGWLADDLINRVTIQAAAASDARMGGAPFAAMSNSGSGNQGIAATMPVVVVADWLQASAGQRLRALALSHLIAIYCKRSQPKLSALCAASTAAMGAAAAITWLMDGDERQIHSALCNMTSDISGILCDGANAGCAMKVSTSVCSATRSALLAIADSSLVGEGIAANDADQAVANLGRFSQQALKQADPIIISML